MKTENEDWVLSVDPRRTLVSLLDYGDVLYECFIQASSILEYCLSLCLKVCNSHICLPLHRCGPNPPCTIKETCQPQPHAASPTTRSNSLPGGDPLVALTDSSTKRCRLYSGHWPVGPRWPGTLMSHLVPEHDVCCGKKSDLLEQDSCLSSYTGKYSYFLFKVKYLVSIFPQSRCILLCHRVSLPVSLMTFLSDSNQNRPRLYQTVGDTVAGNRWWPARPRELSHVLIVAYIFRYNFPLDRMPKCIRVCRGL